MSSEKWKILGAELVHYPFIKTGALEKIPFSLIGNAKDWYDKGEDSACPINRPPLAMVKSYYLFGGYRTGGATAAGVKPPWALSW